MARKNSDTLAYAENFDEGLRTDVSSDKAPEGSLVIANNVRFIPRGGFYLRRGTEEMADLDQGDTIAVEQFGRCIEHNVTFTKCGTKIFQSNDHFVNNYDIFAGLTTAARGQFVEYNSQMKYSNGSDNYLNITVGLVDTAFDQDDTSVVMRAGHAAQFLTAKTSTVTADAGTDKLSWTSTTLVDGERVMFSVSGGGSLPGGLDADTIYFVVNKETNAFQVAATSGGSAIDLTSTGSGTITVTTGILACKGVLLTYTGTSTDTFTGVIVKSTLSAASGSVVTQLEDVAGAPAATVLESVFEKMMGAGVGTASHAIYYTKTANIDNPEYIDDWTNTGADQELFGKYGKITAMKTLLNKMYVAKDLGFEAWTDIDADGIPVREPFDESYGVINGDCLIRTGNKLSMITSPTRRIKTIEPDTTGVNPEPVINPFFDLKIDGTLRNLDQSQTRARMGYNEQDTFMRCTMEKSDTLQTLVYHTQTEGFSIDTGYSPNCWLEWDGIMYFGDANTDKIWKAESGFTDGDSSPFMEALTPIHYVGDRRRKNNVKELFLTGLIKRRTTMTVEIYCDGVLHRSVDIVGTGNYVSKASFRPFGHDAIGRDPFGRSGGEPGETDGFEFAVPIGINFECRHVQVKFKCQGNGYGVQVDSYELVAGEPPTTSETQLDTI